jgi:myo-inositol-1(or 4)-monophosphatase
MGEKRVSRSIETLDFALDLAREAGERLLDFFQRIGRIESDNKRDGSLLTEADLAANELIIRHIKHRFGDHGILTEEGMTIAPENPYTWIIDPLDGTTNFTWGIPIWGVSIALAYKGEPELGVVVFPALSKVYSTIKGEGVCLNDVTVKVDPPETKADNRIFVTCTNTLKNYTLKIPYKLRVSGSASYNIITVAEGNAAGGMEHKPKIWDVAAGHLIIEETGALINYPDSKPFFPYEPKIDYRDISYPIMTAIDMETFQILVESIKPRE